MKKFYFGVSYLLISLVTNNVQASISETDQIAFFQAGFKVQSLSALENQYKSNFTQKLTDFYSDSEEYKNISVIVEYPKAPSKTEANYAPPRSKIEGSEDLVPLDTIVMSRYKDLQGPSQTSELTAILNSWVEKGFSCHALLPAKGGIVFWVDPTLYKGQMAGEWNAHSLEVLTGTPSTQQLLPSQITSLSSVRDFINGQGEKIKYLISHGEARGSKENGTITNIDEVRKELGLSGDNKKYEQTPLPS